MNLRMGILRVSCCVRLAAPGARDGGMSADGASDFDGVDVDTDREMVRGFFGRLASVCGVRGQSRSERACGKDEVDAPCAPRVWISAAVFPVADRGLPGRSQVGCGIDHV